MNSSNQPGREKEIFEQALDLPSPEAQLGYVKGACGGDADLLARVQTLLRAHEATGGFLPEDPGVAPGPTVSHAMAESSEKPGTVIGRYKLLEKIGEGGFGSVYMAEQEVPVRRRVALKVIKLGMDTKEVIARFEAERQALAMMDHPNIAKVLDGGATNTGRPYFVMELVKGVPITTYCDQRQLSTQARLELFMLVCQAVQHAHQKGIIHRDIKPSNILVTEQDDRPVPKVIDFGVARATQARLTEKTMFTQFHQMVGTPAYMSPEQTGLANLDIDTRSDIYSLGVLLYELLTGCTPFDSKKLLAAGYEGIMRMIREVEPPKPSTRLSSLSVQELSELGGRRQEEPRRLGRLVQGDLDWIVMKALEKDRTRRYETASDLAADLQRHLGNEPIVARPASSFYRLQKLVARNKLAVGAAVIVTAALVIGLAVTSWAYFNEKSARQFAVEAALNHKKASDGNRTILIRAADYKRRADANDRQVAIEAAKSSYALAVMKDMLDHVPPGESTALRGSIDAAAARLTADPHVPPEAVTELSETFGDFYMTVGEFAPAERMFRQMLDLRRKQASDGNPDLMPVVQKLIEALKRQGKDTEARKVKMEAEHAQSAYLRSDRWINRLKAETQALQARGLFADAEAKLMDAMVIGWANPSDRYDPLADLGLLARLRLAGGDLDGAEEIARRWIDVKKAGRRWTEAGTLGFFSRASDQIFADPYDAHTVLGLIALREGDEAAARTQLLQSADAVNPRMELDWNKLELATAIAAAGDQVAASRFLDRMRPRYVESLRARDLNNSLFLPQSSMFYNAALGEAHAAELSTWQLELSAGKIPADWERFRESARLPAAATGGSSLPAVQILALPPAPPASGKFLSLFPFAFLMLGWCATAAAPWGRNRGRLSVKASWWLLAFCSARTLDCAIFTGTILGNGFLPSLFLSLFVSFFSWLLMWKFVHALLPDESSRGEKRFMHAVFAFGLLEWCAYLGVGYMNTFKAFSLSFRVGLMLLLLLTFALAFGVCFVAGRRLWRWQRNADLSRGQRLSLKFAIPLLVVHGYVSIFAGVIHDQASPPVADAIFWATALLPWLLAAGFLGRRQTDPYAATPISGPNDRAPAH